LYFVPPTSFNPGVISIEDCVHTNSGQGEYTMIRVASTRMNPSVLGMEETEILKTIMTTPCDIQMIHFITGIPQPCIEGKLRALVCLGLVRAYHDGRFVCYDEAVFMNAREFP
jgi:hypothetical protein